MFFLSSDVLSCAGMCLFIYFFLYSSNSNSNRDGGAVEQSSNRESGGTGISDEHICGWLVGVNTVHTWFTYSVLWSDTVDAQQEYI